MRRRPSTQALAIAAAAVVAALAPATAAQAETIYGLSTTNTVSTFDSATPGTVTSVAVTGLQPAESLLAIDTRPATGQLYGLGSTSRIYTVNAAPTAVAAPVAALTV